MEKIIWLIDDDMVSQFAITYAIQQSFPDYKVTCFYSPLEALDALDKCHTSQIGFPSKLLVDLSMPTKSGWWFIEELEKSPDILKMLEVYIVSAFTNSNDRSSAEIHPIVKGYLDKPISKSSIAKVFK